MPNGPTNPWSQSNRSSLQQNEGDSEIYLAISGNLHLATNGDFHLATGSLCAS